MPPINLLIKPVSSACNMKCKYCFYIDLSNNRNEQFLGKLSIYELEKLVIHALDYADDFCGFAFQGGEPTLAGLDFYNALIIFQKKHNKKNVKINNSIQTNGYYIDETWAKFFKDNNFLVGLSLDGPKKINDYNRIDIEEKETFSKVMNTVNLFNRYNVDYNILSVITGQNAKKIQSIYNFHTKHNFKYLQFIPALEPIENNRGECTYHLSPQQYGDYLIYVFNLWYNDFLKGKYTSVRHIDNIINIALGKEPEACNMRGVCSKYYVIEGDGSVYPCDFYAFDNLKLGNIIEQNFNEINQNTLHNDFIQQSVKLPKKCQKCDYVYFCRNGCKRDRVKQNDELINYYCESYKKFYQQCMPKITNCANILKNNMRNYY